MSTQLKICNGTLCKGTYKPIEKFYKQAATIDGVKSSCGNCENYDKKINSSTFDGFLRSLLKEVKRGCKQRTKDIVFNITVDDIRNLYIKQEGKCALTKRVLTHTKIINRDVDDHCQLVNRWNISVDRIDSTKGYEKDNIQLLGSIVNRIKNDLPQADFISICKMVS